MSVSGGGRCGRYEELCRITIGLLGRHPRNLCSFAPRPPLLTLNWKLSRSPTVLIRPTVLVRPMLSRSPSELRRRFSPFSTLLFPLSLSSDDESLDELSS